MIALELHLPPETKSLAKRLLRVKSHSRTDGQLATAIDKNLTRFAPAWRRGLEHADARGRAAVALLESQLTRTKPSADLSVQDAAVMASMVGAYESHDLFPYAEILWRARGPKLCVEVLVEMWQLATDYHNSGRALWLYEPSDEKKVRLDASVSYAKGSMGHFLYERQDSATDEQRAELASAAYAYRDAPFHVQVPVAFAARDSSWADVLIDRMRAEPSTFGFYADQLMHVTEDIERIQWFLDKRRCQLGLSFVLRLPPEAAFSLYERQLDSKLPNTVKDGLVQQLANLRGSAVAKLLLRFAEKRPFRPHVRAYFTRHPDLLEEVGAAPGDDVDPNALSALQKAVNKALSRAKA